MVTSYKLTASYMDFISGRQVLTQKMACWGVGGVLLAYIMHYGAHLLLLSGHAHLTSQRLPSVLKTESHPPKPVKRVHWLPPAHFFSIMPVCTWFICTVSTLTSEEPLHPHPGTGVDSRWETFIDAGRLGHPMLVLTTLSAYLLFFNISHLCIICFYFHYISSASH